MEQYLKETLAADQLPANWAWVSQKDGRAPEGGAPWLVDAIPSSSTEEALGKITGWSMELLRCQSAPLALYGSISTAARTAQISTPVLVCDVSEAHSFLVSVSGQGVVGFASAAVGFDALAEATQGALGLKFRGSAARLLFNESYDFADSAAKIVEPLAVGIRLALPNLGSAPTHFVCAGVLARQAWITQALAGALNLKPLAIDGSAWASAHGISLSSKITEVHPSWLGVLGAVAAYDPKNPGAALPWNPILTNTPVAAAPVIPAIIQEPAPAPKPTPPPAVVITPPQKPAEPAPAPKQEAPKPAAKAPEPAPAPKPAVVITPPPKPVEPPKPVVLPPKTPPPAKPVEQKPAAKAPEKPASAAAKPGAKQEPAKPAAPSAASKPTLAPAPAPAAKPPSTAPFPAKKKSPMPMVIGLIIVLIVGAGGFWMYSENKAAKEEQAKRQRELEQRAAAEASARRDAEEKARKEAEARKKAEQEAAERAVLAEKERIRAEEETRVKTAQELLNARGSLTINTDPMGATVVVGELAPRPSPLSMKDLRLGRYSVTISFPGYDTETREIEIKANETTDLGTIKLHRQVGGVDITSDPAGLDYELKPAGALFVNPADIRTGKTPATLSDVPVGAYQLTISRPNWPNYVGNISVERNGTAKAHGTFVGATVVINSNPQGGTVMRDQVQLGTTPLTLNDLQPGDMTFTITMRGLEPATVSGRAEAGKTLTLNGTLLDIDKVMRLSDLDERPVPIQQVEPDLSSSARAEGGSATIEFVVGKDGLPTELRVVNASNPALGRACMAAAAKWKFRPGYVRGKAVRTRMILPFRMAPQN
ncbi:hypothetical protein DB347_22000 [Opitutaceae bacterium EW11]|nr:hypothetical protein DB347_22000 [Opitutaceae bacterium EW11]